MDEVKDGIFKTLLICSSQMKVNADTLMRCD